MINGIKPEPSSSDFGQALLRLLDNIREDYEKWSHSAAYRCDEGDMRSDITIKPGRKFIKIMRINAIWGFVAKADGMHKGVPMKAGDVLKAASRSAPAKHTRGNIFDNNQDYFRWTGPDYR